MLDLSLTLVDLPDVTHLTSDGSSYLLGSKSVGFSEDAALEIVEVSIRDVGYGYSGVRKGYFIYDVREGSFYQWDFAQELAKSLGVNSSDISLYDASISGTKSSFSAAVSYKSEGASELDARKIALFDGKTVVDPDIIEQISGEFSNAVLNNLRINGSYIFFETAAFNINTNAELDSNEAIDVYRLSISDRSIERVSTVAGLEFVGHSNIEDIKLNQDWIGQLFTTQSPISQGDTNDEKDVILQNYMLDSNEIEFQLLALDSDGKFLNRGIESADWFYDNDILISTRSDLSDLNVYGDELKLVLWDIEFGIQKLLETGLENFQIFGAANSRRIILALGEDITNNIGQQAYVLKYDSDYGLLDKSIVSVYNGHSVSDQILGGEISENGNAIALNISDVQWGVDDYLPLGRNYSLILSRGLELTLGGRSLNHGTITAELDGVVSTISSDTSYFDLQGTAIGTVTLDPAMHTSDIGIGDVIANLRHIVGLSPLSGKSALAADVDNDGNIGIGDVISQLRHIVGLSPINRFDVVAENGQLVGGTLGSQTSIELILNGDVDLSTEVLFPFYEV